MLDLLTGLFGGNFGYIFLGLVAIVGSAFALPMFMTFLTKFKTNKILQQDQQNNQVLVEAKKVLDTKIEETNVEEAKVDQKLDDLATKEVTSTDVSNFLKEMQEEADKEKK